MLTRAPIAAARSLTSLLSSGANRQLAFRRGAVGADAARSTPQRVLGQGREATARACVQCLTASYVGSAFLCCRTTAGATQMDVRTADVALQAYYYAYLQALRLPVFRR